MNWIDVKENLPKKNGTYFVICKDLSYYKVGTANFTTNCLGSNDDIIVSNNFYIETKRGVRQINNVIYWADVASANLPVELKGELWN